jgi:hypothetical protein
MASQIPTGDQTTSSWSSNAPENKSRNPYEMRFDLLHLAKEILEQNAHMAREDKAQDRKSWFTTDEVIATAEKLNKFVSNTR